MSSASTTRFSSSIARGLGAAALAAALALVPGCSKQGGSGAGGGRGGALGHGEIGTRAPAFSLPDLDGKVVSSSSYAGKVVILDFWATWCGPCRLEVPHFVNLQSKYGSQGLVVVGLSIDQGGAADVQPFADEFHVNYPILFADEGTTSDYGGIAGIPTTFVIDRSGKVVKRFIGYTPPEVFEETIRPLLRTTS
jgi:peroxiredoxin